MLLTRRQKRLLPLILLLSLPILLLIIRLAWGAYADHHLAQTRASLKAQGFRVYPEDFSPKSITTESRAAALILRAATSLKLTPQQRTVLTGENHLPHPYSHAWYGDDFAHIRQAVAANLSAFDDVDQAAREPRPSFSKPFVGNPSPYDLALLAQLFFAASLEAHNHHDDLNSIAHLQRILFIAEILTAHSDRETLYTTLNLNSQAAEGVTRIHSTLRIDDATRPLVRKLIASLFHDEIFENQIEAGIAFEAQSALNGKKFVSDDFRSWPIRPSCTLAAARYLHAEFLFASTARSQNWNTVSSVAILRSSSDVSLLDNITLHNLWHRDTLRCLQSSFHSKVDRHAAATLLAAALYRVDHNEKNAPSLAELTPAYLPSTPMDPYSPFPHPLRYRATPILLVWSVGSDGVDKGASTIPLPVNEDLAYIWPSGGPQWREENAVYGPLRDSPPQLFSRPSPP